MSCDFMWYLSKWRWSRFSTEFVRFSPGNHLSTSAPYTSFTAPWIVIYPDHAARYHILDLQVRGVTSDWHLELAGFLPWLFETWKKSESTLLSCTPDFRKVIAFGGSCPLVFLVKATGNWRWLRIIGGMIQTEENLSQSHLFTTNLTWTGLGSNPDLRGNRTANNDLSRGTAFKPALRLSNI
jgi:hypothetical protein